MEPGETPQDSVSRQEHGDKPRLHSLELSEFAKLSGDQLKVERNKHNAALVLIIEKSAYFLPENQEIILGRSSDCDIVIDNALLSRRHCSVTIQSVSGHPTDNNLHAPNFDIRVKDLGSKNGIYDASSTYRITEETLSFKQYLPTEFKVLNHERFRATFCNEYTGMTKLDDERDSRQTLIDRASDNGIVISSRNSDTKYGGGYPLRVGKNFLIYPKSLEVQLKLNKSLIVVDRFKSGDAPHFELIAQVTCGKEGITHIEWGAAGIDQIQTAKQEVKSSPEQLSLSRPEVTFNFDGTPYTINLDVLFNRASNELSNNRARQKEIAFYVAESYHNFSRIFKNYIPQDKWISNMLALTEIVHPNNWPSQGLNAIAHQHDPRQAYPGAPEHAVSLDETRIYYPRSRYDNRARWNSILFHEWLHNYDRKYELQYRNWRGVREGLMEVIANQAALAVDREPHLDSFKNTTILPAETVDLCRQTASPEYVAFAEPIAILTQQLRNGVHSFAYAYYAGKLEFMHEIGIRLQVDDHPIEDVVQRGSYILTELQRNFSAKDYRGAKEFALSLRRDDSAEATIYHKP